jgi:hypothetical protein
MAVGRLGCRTEFARLLFVVGSWSSGGSGPEQVTTRKTGMVAGTEERARPTGVGGEWRSKKLLGDSGAVQG